MGHVIINKKVHSYNNDYSHVHLLCSSLQISLQEAYSLKI